MKTRDKTFDIARGICIIIMIIVHYLSYQRGIISFPLDKYTGTFFLVFFFIVSGYFYKRPDDSKEYLKKRFKKLFIPYIIITYIYLLYISFVKGFYIGNDILSTIKIDFVSLITALPASIENISFFNVNTIGIGPIWFLNCLFITNMIYLLIDKYSKHKFIVSLILALIAQLSQQFFTLPFNIQDALVGCLFMAIGDCGRKYISKYDETLTKKSIVIDLIIVLIQIIIYYYIINYVPQQWLNLGENKYNILSMISTLFGIAILINISVIIKKIKILDWFLPIYGSDSMYILIMHNIDILMLRVWSNRTVDFCVATILGYYFFNMIRSNLTEYFKKIEDKYNEKFIKNVKT